MRTRRKGSVLLLCACIAGQLGCGFVGIELIDVAEDASQGALDAGGRDAGQREGGVTSDGSGVSEDASVDARVQDAGDTDSGETLCGRVPTFGLVGHWPFDDLEGDVASDVVGQAHGRLVGMEEAAWTHGPLGGALVFDGNEQHVNIGNTYAGVRTLTFWMRASRLSATTTETPWFSPTAHGDPNDEWGTPDRAYALDGRYATADFVAPITRQDWHGFGVAVPGAPVIRGIQVDVFLNNSTNPASSFAIELSWNGGTSYTSTGNRSPITASNNYVEFGGANEGWGRTWQWSELANENLRVRLTKGSGWSPILPGVDHIQLMVFHDALRIDPTVVKLNTETRLQIVDEAIAAVNLPTATVYLDGERAGRLGDGWHHVTITDPQGFDLFDFMLGGVAREAGSYAGLLDDVRIYDRMLSEHEIRALVAEPTCP